MVSFEITASEFEGLTRLDPEYYQPAYRKHTKPIADICEESMKSVCDIVMGPAYSSKSFNTIKESIPISKIGDVTNKRSIDNWETISRDEFIKYHSVLINKNDILLTMTGDPPDVGKTYIPYSQYHLDRLITFNQRVAKIRGRSIDQFYLYAFLQSEKFRLRIEQVALGIRQRNISIPDLKSAYIFIPDDDKDISFISDLIKRHFELEQLSQSLYTQAQEILERELGLDKLVFDRPLSYEARLSEVVGKHRGDAEFHNPTLRLCYHELNKNSQLNRITKYGDVLKFGNPAYANSGVPIITQKHLQEITPSGYGTDLLADESWVNKYPKAILRKNDLLFYSVGAYLGKTNIWLNEDKAVHASFITMIRCNEDYDAGYLMVLLNSKYGILQSKVFQSGTSQQYIYPKDIKQFLIPEVEKSIKVKIADYIFKSHQAKIESHQLLEQAKHRVEQLIEQAVQK